MSFLRRFCWVVFVVGFSAGATTNSVAAQGSERQQRTSLDFCFADEQGWQFDGTIDLPPVNRRNNFAVLLLAGGLSTDIDWTVQGLMSISGRPHRDGKTLALALVKQGFVVIRYSMIRQGDPLHARDPLLAEAPDMARSMEHARLALQAYRSLGITPEHKLFLIGHSLGAHRAANLLRLNPRIAGVILLAGAYLAPQNELFNQTVQEARKTYQQLDANQNGFLDNHESWGGEAIAAEKNQPIDLSGFTLAYLRRRQTLWQPKNQSASPQFVKQWPVETLSSLTTPVLFIVGDRERQWLADHFALATALQRSKHPDFTARLMRGLGHNLGQQLPAHVQHPTMGLVATEKLGPIDPQCVQLIVSWLHCRVDKSRR